MLVDLGISFIDSLDVQRSHADETALRLMSGTADNLVSVLMATHPFGQHINDLGNPGITGIRVSAAKHIVTFELAALVGKMGGGSYRFRDVTGQAGETVTPEVYYHVVDITDFKSPLELAANLWGGGNLQYSSPAWWLLFPRAVGESGVLMPGGLDAIVIDSPDTQRSHSGEAGLTLMGGTVCNLGNSSLASVLVLTRSRQATRGVLPSPAATVTMRGTPAHPCPPPRSQASRPRCSSTTEAGKWSSRSPS